MTPLDARHVHEPGGAADQRATGKRQLWYRLPSAFGQCARAVGKPFATFERRAHQRMRFETLKFLERLEIGIFIIEMHDEPDRSQTLVKMIKERTAAGAVTKRPAECVLHEAGPVFFRRDLP